MIFFELQTLYNFISKVSRNWGAFEFPTFTNYQINYLVATDISDETKANTANVITETFLNIHVYIYTQYISLINYTN